tara:strand:- start:311 stop:667 length:357 start_codon:yes stop_codon:yes gene_type:complete
MPRLGNKKYSYDKKGMKEYKKDKFKKGIQKMHIDSMINKSRADMAIRDSVSQAMANKTYMKAINVLNQKIDSLQKNHQVQLTQIEKQHMIDMARNKNLPNRKQSGPAATPKRGGGEVK